MVFLLEEIVVEGAAIIATIAAASILVLVLAGFALQRRASRAETSTRRSASHSARAEGPAPAQRALAHRG
jgi:ABC-type Fe3+ transport system permease subunit